MDACPDAEHKQQLSPKNTINLGKVLAKKIHPEVDFCRSVEA